MNPKTFLRRIELFFVLAALVTFALQLETSAPGFIWRLANHSRVITYNGLVYRAFPKHDPIEIGHVCKLARFLGILACAKNCIPGL